MVDVIKEMQESETWALIGQGPKLEISWNIRHL